MTRLEEIFKDLKPTQIHGDALLAITRLLELVEKQREALKDIADHSQAPFADPYRLQIDNLKWIVYINDVAKEALAKEIGE